MKLILEDKDIINPAIGKMVEDFRKGYPLSEFSLSYKYDIEGCFIANESVNKGNIVFELSFDNIRKSY